MSLRISLRDGEKVIVNGAVLSAVGRVCVEVRGGASILRGKDLMRPEEANTPARRLYFTCMMAYIDEGSRATYHDVLVDLVKELLGALESAEARGHCVVAAQKIACGEFYGALADCRWLIRYEAEALQRDASEAA